MMFDKYFNGCSIERLRFHPCQLSNRGMRVTVGMVVGQIGAGRTIENVLEDFPYLELEDVLEALQYAAWLSQEREIVLATR
jgi:uncharacterized protein (DUF433 family)